MIYGCTSSSARSTTSMHTGTVIMVLTALGIPPVCLFGHEVGREVWACSGNLRFRRWA